MFLLGKCCLVVAVNTLHIRTLCLFMCQWKCVDVDVHWLTSPRYLPEARLLAFSFKFIIIKQIFFVMLFCLCGSVITIHYQCRWRYHRYLSISYFSLSFCVCERPIGTAFGSTHCLMVVVNMLYLMTLCLFICQWKCVDFDVHWLTSPRYLPEASLLAFSFEMLIISGPS